MKTLTLMRHAKSDWNHPELKDYERPLNTRGLKTAPEMAARLAERWNAEDKPDVLISSIALRAETTAKAVAKALELPLQLEKRLYPFVAADVAAVLAEQDSVYEHVMLFGHNPGISYLAMQLGVTEMAEMPTASVVSMQFDIASWGQLMQNRCLSYWFDFPKSAE